MRYISGAGNRATDELVPGPGETQKQALDLTTATIVRVEKVLARLKVQGNKLKELGQQLGVVGRVTQKTVDNSDIEDVALSKVLLPHGRNDLRCIVNRER